MNKKTDQTQKSEIVSAELKEIEVGEEDKQKDDPKNWKELKERNLTLEEILSLETNNAVTLMIFFKFPKTFANLNLSF